MKYFLAWKNIGLCVVIIGLSFWVTSFNQVGWDDVVRLNHSNWLLGEFGLGSTVDHDPWHYAPLWELIMGICTRFIFFFVEDPLWVRHACTFALYLFGLWGVWRGLISLGISKSTSILSVAGLFAIIRWGGHAQFNVKDAPAATVFLLAFIGICLCIQYFLKTQKLSQKYWALFLAGIVSVLPYLVRSPLIMHLVFLLGFLFIWGFLTKERYSISHRIGFLLIPLFSGLTFIVLTSPHLWTLDFQEWIKPFTKFSSFYPHEYTLVWGHYFPASNLPWWYVFAWIPVMIHPLALFFWGVGVFAFFWKGIQARCMKLKLYLLGTFQITFPTVLLVSTIVIWGALIIKNPWLTSEERHILFLYPPLFLIGFLGLDFLRPKLKYIMVFCLVAVSFASYVHWGRYGFVYKSSIISPEDQRGKFMGDYWGACLPEMIERLPEILPEKYPIIIGGPQALAQNRIEQLTKENPGYSVPVYRLLKNEKVSPPYGVFLMKYWVAPYEQLLKDAQKGKARVIWEATMPPNDKTCILGVYEEEPFFFRKKH